MINQYKRLDVFRCNYESHSKFDNKVSVYHVLKKKKCWPTGCISFKWKCKFIDKGKRCIKGYRYIGKNCGGCSYYEDIKIHNQPQISLSQEDTAHFWEELQEFEDWFETHSSRELSIFGNLVSVKPFLKKYISHNREQLHLTGYNLVFLNGYLGTTEYQDFFYAPISTARQTQYQFSAGDQIEFRAKLSLDQGRLIVRQMWQLEFIEKSKKTPLTLSDILVAKETATIFKTQSRKCLHCPHSVLVDVLGNRKDGANIRRELFCLKGIPDPEFCTVQVMEALAQVSTVDE